MIKFKKFSVVAIAATAVIASNYAALAADQDIGASANFREALSFSSVVPMSYGIINYSAATANNITLSPNDGAISCSNTADYACPTTGTAGSADINGTTGQIVQISCETGGIVSDGSNTIPLNTTKVRIGGSDTSCAGLGASPVSFTLTSGVDALKVGAVLAVPSTGIASPGAYSTANASGDPVAVRVVYQ